MRKKWFVLSHQLKETATYIEERIEARCIAERFYSGFGAMRETSGMIHEDRIIKAFGALGLHICLSTWRLGRFLFTKSIAAEVSFGRSLTN